MSYIAKKAVTILNKAPDERNNDDIAFLQKLITANIPLLSYFQERFHKLLCMGFTYKKMEKKEILYLEDNVADSFFIVLSGTTGLFKNVKNENNEHSKYGEKSSYKEELKINEEIKEVIEGIELQNDWKLELEKQFSEGFCFGEFEFIKNLKRPFTAICLENCELIVLKKEKLVELINGQKEIYKKNVECIEFLKSTELFNKMNNSFLKEVFFNLKIQTYKHNDIVYKEFDYANEFFIFREMEKNKLMQSQTQQLEINSMKIKKTNEEKDNKTSLSKTHFCLALYSAGDFFGEYELVYPNKREFVALCVSPGEIYAINKHFFLKKMLHDKTSYFYIVNPIIHKNIDLIKNRYKQALKIYNLNFIKANLRLQKNIQKQMNKYILAQNNNNKSNDSFVKKKNPMPGHNNPGFVFLNNSSHNVYYLI